MYIEDEKWPYGHANIVQKLGTSIFKLRTEAYTSTLGLLTDPLTHSSIRIMILETWQRRKKLLLQGFRQQVTWPTLLGGGNNLDHVCLKGDMGI